MRLVDSLLFTTKPAIPPLRLVLRRPAKPALEGRAAGTRAGRHGGKATVDSLLFTTKPAIDALSRPWFETRGFAALLTMRSQCISPRQEPAVKPMRPGPQVSV